ncbi:MAG: hypothetical protein J6W11_00950 [Alphaproteobacteria bacterium]|nr:hypothetical protein [Alphaproteobacteria bacterium]
MGKNKKEVVEETTQNIIYHSPEYENNLDDRSWINTVTDHMISVLDDEIDTYLIKIFDAIDELENLFIKYNMHYSDHALMVIKWHLDHIYADFCVRHHALFLKRVSKGYVYRPTEYCGDTMCNTRDDVE